VIDHGFWVRRKGHKGRLRPHLAGVWGRKFNLHKDSENF